MTVAELEEELDETRTSLEELYDAAVEALEALQADDADKAEEILGPAVEAVASTHDMEGDEEEGPEEEAES